MQCNFIYSDCQVKLNTWQRKELTCCGEFSDSLLLLSILSDSIPFQICSSMGLDCSTVYLSVRKIILRERGHSDTGPDSTTSLEVIYHGTLNKHLPNLSRSS